jgi:acyl-[acyl-carrier-protein]-phospholipid O-acyltransferase/long-chain-fatty-acid--[acyl-carrier-protein] ligase
MPPFSWKRPFSLRDILRSPKDHSLAFLNASQFTGVLNDNIYKLVMVFLLIDIEGPQRASFILSAAGALFVIPFLLFSSAAGVLADRFSKQRLLVCMKGLETVIMLLALFAFGFRSTWASYTLLFVLSTQAALFGPSKYGIIPELVPASGVSRANGLVTSFTYLGIIVGTFLASFFTEITNRHFVLTISFCLLISLAGFCCTLGIKPTASQDSDKRINLLFVREILRTLVACRKTSHLLPAIFGSAYFLFIGAFAQLNIIPFALQSLHLSEIAGGYLFLATALGIALGAYLAGKASRRRIEIGLSCLAGWLIASFLLLLALFSGSLGAVIALLVLLGFCGGIFIVPFDSFVQLFSADKSRGQVIAAGNFLSFCGVLIASAALYLFSEVLGLSAASGFAVVGLLTLLVSALFTARLSNFAFPYAARLFFRPQGDNLSLLEEHPRAVLVMEQASWKDACALMALLPNTHFLFPEGSKRTFPWIRGLFFSFHLIPQENQLETAKTYAREDRVPCLLLKTALREEERSLKLKDLLRFSDHPLLYATVSRTEQGTVVSLKTRR